MYVGHICYMLLWIEFVAWHVIMIDMLKQII